MTITLTPPPITMSAAALRHRITHLDRAADRAERLGQYGDALAYVEAMDECALERAARTRAERGAIEREALVRHLDMYEVSIDEIMERR